MKVDIVGEGDPKVAVVGLVHGDDVCGLRAIRRIKKEIEMNEISLNGAIKLVIANEKAFEQGKRYVDADLNRSFPGDLKSDKHEEELAARLYKELDGLKVLDLHSSESPETPFSIVSGLEQESIEVACSTGLNRLVEISYVEGGLIDNLDAAVVECGFHNTEESSKVAYEVTTNFLAAHGIIDEETDVSRPNVFKIYDKAEGSNYEFTAENFKLVEEGEVFAEKEAKTKEAAEKFWPVLASTHGYSDMIGFKAKKLT